MERRVISEETEEQQIDLEGKKIGQFDQFSYIGVRIDNTGRQYIERDTKLEKAVELYSLGAKFLYNYDKSYQAEIK